MNISIVFKQLFRNKLIYTYKIRDKFDKISRIPFRYTFIFPPYPVHSFNDHDFLHPDAGGSFPKLPFFLKLNGSGSLQFLVPEKFKGSFFRPDHIMAPIKKAHVQASRILMMFGFDFVFQLFQKPIPVKRIQNRDKYLALSLKLQATEKTAAR